MTFLLTALLLAAPTAGPRVVLRGETRSDVVQQLKSELTTLGFQVEVDASKEALSWRTLRQRARDAKAVAAIRLEEAEGELELWVSDLSTGKVLIRALPTGGSPSARVVALRVVELLRLSFREVGEPETLDVKEVEPPPAPVLEQLTPPPDAPRLWLSVGATGLLSAGGVTPAGLAFLGAGFRPMRWLTLLVEGWIPVVTSTVTGPEGRAELRFWSAQAGARAAPWTFSVVEPGVSLRAGVLGAEMVGSALAPFVGRLERVATPAGTLGVDARLRLGAAVAVRFELFATLALPPVVVIFGDRVAARWGQPTVGLIVSLEVGLRAREP